MKDFNPFAGISWFVMTCIILVLFTSMFIAQIIMAAAWYSWMWAGVCIVLISVWNCWLSWKEYQQEK